MVKNLRREGTAVFWTATEYEFGEYVETDYRTNEAGEGIFVNDDFWYTKQKVGTCDFQLKQKTLSGVRKALNKYFN